MPRKSGEGPGPSEDASSPSQTRQIIDQGIDALNAMCVEMRRLGMVACAEALDQAFATCLQEYVVLYDVTGEDDRADPDNAFEDD